MGGLSLEEKVLSATQSTATPHPIPGPSSSPGRHFCVVLLRSQKATSPVDLGKLLPFLGLSLPSNEMGWG